MGKEGFLTPKAIGNRIKAKGLQKLRWYCQLCEKQCRDENGFKCHTESESHMRQVRLFGENTDSYIENYSKEFEKTFIDLLSRRYCSKRVKATEVYNEHISDRQHVHMNSTKWTTLTQFVQHLGKLGVVEVDETPKGWYITYVRKEDPEKLAMRAKKEKSDLDDNERQQRMLEKQMRDAQSMLGGEVEQVEDKQPEEFHRESEEKIKLSLGNKVKLAEAKIAKVANVFDVPALPNKSSGHAGAGHSGEKRKASEMELLMEEEEKRKAKNNRKDHWVTEGIVVKVMNKKLADGAYYKKKGKVLSVQDRYLAEIEISDGSGDVLRLHQDQLETVIPNEGGRVMIVNGAYRGDTAVVQSINVDKFCATVRIDKGPHRDRVVAGVDYEDLSKLA